MVYWQRLKRFLLRWWGWETQFPPAAGNDSPLLEVDDETHTSLHFLAEKENRSEDELVSDLLYKAIAHRTAEHEFGQKLLQRWLLLTLREQQVTVLACQGYTNRQIAVRLRIAPDTVKTHLRQVLMKLGFRNKRELRSSLSGWEFSSSEREGI